MYEHVRSLLLLYDRNILRVARRVSLKTIHCRIYKNMSAFIKCYILWSLISVAYGIPIINTLVTASRALNIVRQVNEFIDNIIMGDSETDQFDQLQEQLLSDMKVQIDAAKVEILSSIILRSKLDRIDTTAMVIQSSLMDLRAVIGAKKGADELLRIFISRYEDQNVVTHVRFLKTLLTYVTPGDSVDLITLVREGARCGATAMNDFRTRYINLIIDGALLDITYLSVTTQNVNITASYANWAQVLLDVDTIFLNQRAICDTRFVADVQTDLKNNNDPKTLSTELADRYPKRNFDTIFYSGFGSDQFHAFHYTPKLHEFFWERDLDTRNKVLVLTDNNGKPNWNKTSTKSTLDSCITDVSVDKDDTRAAENVLTKLFTCHGLMYPLGVVVVYFEGDDFPTEDVIKNADSPVVELTVEGVTLKYCFKSAFLCTFHKDETSGRFRIFVYPNVRDDINETDYVLSGGRGTHSLFSWSWLMLTLVALYKRIDY